jgi:cytochrome P450
MATLDTTQMIVPDEIARAVIMPESFGDEKGIVFPACRWLRENMPIGLAKVEGYEPVWLLAKNKDIKKMLSDADLFHSADFNASFQTQANEEYMKSKYDGTTRVLDALTWMDPPEHTKYRSAQIASFQPAHVKGYEERFRRLAKEMVDRFLETGGECDFLRTLAFEYPLRAVMGSLGVPQEDFAILAKVTSSPLAGDDPEYKRADVELSPEQQAKQWDLSVQELGKYFDAVRRDRLKSPREDLASELVNARTDEGDLLPDAIQNAGLIGTAIAGHDSTASAITSGMLGLLRFPDQIQKLRDDDSLYRSLPDECIRWATPVKHVTRNTTRETSLGGVEMGSMERVMALLVSGNRDEEIFSDPEDFDVSRRPNPHVGLNWGAHICIGQHMAKLEIRVLFEELIPRLKTIELAGEPTAKGVNYVWGLTSLPVRFTAA